MSADSSCYRVVDSTSSIIVNIDFVSELTYKLLSVIRRIYQYQRIECMCIKSMLQSYEAIEYVASHLPAEDLLPSEEQDGLLIETMSSNRKLLEFMSYM